MFIKKQRGDREVLVAFIKPTFWTIFAKQFSFDVFYLLGAWILLSVLILFFLLKHNLKNDKFVLDLKK